MHSSKAASDATFIVKDASHTTLQIRQGQVHRQHQQQAYTCQKINVMRQKRQNCKSKALLLAGGGVIISPAITTPAAASPCIPTESIL